MKTFDRYSRGISDNNMLNKGIMLPVKCKLAPYTCNTFGPSQNNMVTGFDWTLKMTKLSSHHCLSNIYGALFKTLISDSERIIMPNTAHPAQNARPNVCLV